MQRPLGPAGGGEEQQQPAQQAAQQAGQQQEQEPLGGAKKGGTHSYAPDPRNADILIGMRDGVSGALFSFSREFRSTDWAWCRGQISLP